MYKKTVWKNRVVEKVRTFTKQDNSDGTITLIPEEGQIIDPGTPVNAANMNNIEDKIEELDKKQLEISNVQPKQGLQGKVWIHTL